MRDTFLSYSRAYVLSHGVHAACAVITTLIIVRSLDPADLGLLELVQVAATFLNLFVGVEITQAIARFLPAASSVDQKRCLVSATLWFAFGVQAVVFLVLIFFAPGLSRQVSLTGISTGLAALAGAMIAIDYLYQFSNNLLRHLLEVRRLATTMVFAAAVLAISTAVMVGVFGAGLPGFFAASAFASLVGFALGSGGWRGHLLPRFDVPLMKRLLRYSSPLVFSSFCFITTSHLDRFVLLGQSNLRDLGMLSVAYRLCSPITFLLFAFQASVTPLTFHHHENRDTRAAITETLHIFMGLALSLILVFTLFAPELTRLLAGPHYPEAAPLVPILAAATLIQGSYFFAPGIFLSGRTVAFSAITLLSAATIPLIGIPMVRLLGLPGIALTRLVSAGFFLAAVLVISQREFRIDYPWRRLLLGGLAVTLLPILVLRASPAEHFGLGTYGLKALALIAGLAALSRFGLLQGYRAIFSIRPPGPP
jgi:O-antigen/teichoic acid export membrane protein